MLVRQPRQEIDCFFCSARHVGIILGSQIIAFSSGMMRQVQSVCIGNVIFKLIDRIPEVEYTEIYIN